MLNEIWKDIPYYDGVYEISNYGRVRNKKTNKYKAQHDNGSGYLTVQLWKNNKGKKEYIHRLVALAFIPNPDKLPQVNHKDEDKQNNYVDNLEWCTNNYNNMYGTKRKRQGESFLNNGKRSNKVNQFTLYGEYVASYRSFREAERANNLSNGALSALFRNGYKQWGGFCWELAS